MADDDYETTLLVIREAYVYKIPPRRAATGYKAADWDLNTPIWSGRLTITSKGDRCFVKLSDNNSGDIFAVCPVTEGAVDPVTDSSRYFALRIENEHGKHAFIGIGFAERTEAFDFSASLQDHQRYVKQERDAAESVKRLDSMPHKDYSLKEGEKIFVDIKNPKKPGESTPKSKTTGGGSGGLLLPPPPKPKSSVSQATGGASSGSSTMKSSSLFDFGSSQEQQPSQQQASNDFFAGATGSGSGTDWVDFGTKQQPSQQSQFGAFSAASPYSQQSMAGGYSQQPQSVVPPFAQQQQQFQQGFPSQQQGYVNQQFGQFPPQQSQPNNNFNFF